MVGYNVWDLFQNNMKARGGWRYRKSYIGRDWSLLNLGDGHRGFITLLCVISYVCDILPSQSFLNILTHHFLLFWAAPFLESLISVMASPSPQVPKAESWETASSLSSPSLCRDIKFCFLMFYVSHIFYGGEIHITILMRTIQGHLVHPQPCATTTSL